MPYREPAPMPVERAALPPFWRRLLCGLGLHAWEWTYFAELAPSLTDHVVHCAHCRVRGVSRPIANGGARFTHVCRHESGRCTTWSPSGWVWQTYCADCFIELPQETR